MLKPVVQLLAAVALLSAAPAHAGSDSYSVGISWGTVAYSSGDVAWRDGSTRKLQLGYELGDTPISFELGLQEARPSLYAPCPSGAVCGAVTFFQDFSAWQLGAGYRPWTHRASGSALILKAGLYGAELSNSTGPGSSSDEYSDTGYFLGAAAALMFTPAVGLRLDWEYLDGLEAVGRHNANALMTGVIVKFGGYPR